MQEHEVNGIELVPFLNWLGAKPRDETFDYNKPGTCAVAQYLKEINPQVDPKDIWAWSSNIEFRVAPRWFVFGLDSAIHDAMLRALNETDEEWISGVNRPIAYGAAHDALAEIIAARQ